MRIHLGLAMAESERVSSDFAELVKNFDLIVMSSSIYLFSLTRSRKSVRRMGFATIPLSCG